MTLAVQSYPLAQPHYGIQEIDAVDQALKSGRTTAGPRVTEFEQGFARYIGAEHAVMVNSGSSADLLLAFGLGPALAGDEVLVPAVTWPTQISSCLAAGLKVRLVDVDPRTLQFDIDDLKRKISGRTRAIFPVHVLGNVGNMSALTALALRESIPVIEDCCEALGSTWKGVHVGMFGNAAAFSFFFSHVLNTMEGGMVVCHFPEDERNYRLMRTHGWEPIEDEYFHFPIWGFNFRPTELQGAFGNVQLGRLEDFLAARQHNWNRLTAQIPWTYLTGINVLPDCGPAWHGYSLMLCENAPFTKRQFCCYLNEHGIETRPIVAGNIARQPAAMNDPRVIAGPLPGADAVHDRGLYIGLSSEDDPSGTSYVAEIISDFLRAY